GVVELENTKSKDSEEFEPVRLKLEQVAIEGMFDRKGRPVTSLVPRTMSMVEEGVALGEMTDDEAALVEIIEQIGAAKPYDDDLRSAFYDHLGDLSQRKKSEKYRKSIDALIKRGSLYRDGKAPNGKRRYRVNEWCFAWGKRDRRDMPFFPKFSTQADSWVTWGIPQAKIVIFLFISITYRCF